MESRIVLKTTHTQTKPDETILIQATLQEPGKFGELYRLYVERIFRYLYSRVGNVQEAEDLTAQTFLAALESFEGYRLDCPFAAWLFGIARNKAVDHYRKCNNSAPLGEAEKMVGGNDPLTGIIRSERAGELAGLIAALPESERELLRLRYLAEMSFDEMAHALKRNADAVKKSLYRLLQRLQRQLESSND
ncbi:MAG: sigma-70 family RNA polymerase sigma factor [Anaerolineaceae bacterium]